MADVPMHLQTFDGHAISTWALHEAARRWHEAHKPREKPQRRDYAVARGILLTEAGKEHQRQRREANGDH